MVWMPGVGLWLLVAMVLAMLLLVAVAVWAGVSIANMTAPDSTPRHEDEPSTSSVA
jgi:hypothetical protein